MPDRYGRFGGEDFMLLARGMRSINEASEQEEAQRQLGLGLGEFSTATSQGRAPVKPEGVSDLNWAKASLNAKAANDARLSVEETRLTNEYLGMANKEQTPEARLKVLEGIRPGDIAGARALSVVQKLVYANQENQAALLGSVLKKGQLEYDTVLQPGLAAASDLLDKGDEEGAANVLAQLSRTLPLRGEYRWDPQTRTLDHYHNERNAGLFEPEKRDEELALGADTGPGSGLGLRQAPSKTPKTGWGGWDGYSYTGSLSVKDALDEVRRMSRKDYALQMAGHRVANMEFNAKALESGGHVGLGPNGEKLRVFPLINLDNAVRQFAVFDEKSGKALGMLGNEEFFTSGIRISTKEQRALDNDARRLAQEDRRLGLREREMGLGGAGRVGKKSLGEVYLGLVNKHEAALSKDLSAPDDQEELRAMAVAKALADVRLLTGDAQIRTEADVVARSQSARGGRSGGVQPQAVDQAQPAAPASTAQALWLQHRSQK